jgi:exodeoxyribonuclease V alpha subunit
MRTSVPASIDGTEKYCGSGMIRGVGPVYAKKVVWAFGERVFDVIEAEPYHFVRSHAVAIVAAKTSESLSG